MSTNTYYVKATIDASGNYADCSYFIDPACTQVAEQPLRIPQSAGVCNFVQAAASPLVLVGSVFKTLGHAPTLNSHNFTPANDEHVVAVGMPTSEIVTKGVVLMFSSPGEVTCLYPSTDPEVKNDDQ